MFFRGRRGDEEVPPPITSTNVATEQMAFDFMQSSARDSLLKKPGYRLACDLYADIFPSFDQPSEAQHSPYPLTALGALEAYLRDSPQERAPSRDTAIEDLIRYNAPSGDSGLVWDLYGMQSADNDYKGNLRRVCRGANVVGYLGALVSLNLTGETGARARMRVAVGRDSSTVMYGHYNQVIRELAEVVEEQLDSPADKAIVCTTFRNNEIPDTIGRMVGQQAFHPSYSRGVVAAEVISGIPWHPRYQEAVTAANKGEVFDFPPSRIWGAVA